jgi:small subunit ribosomal protein S16
MAVRIRLTRKGRRNLPFFRIGVFEGRTKRDGKCLEFLGHYDPVQKETAQKYTLKKERAEYWLSLGAQPSDTVWSIFKTYGINKSTTSALRRKTAEKTVETSEKE